jgi:hypothetical protein
MLHAFVIFCMISSPDICVSFPIQKATYEAPTSIMDCMKGGVIYGAENPTFTDISGEVWKATGGVHCECESDPVKAEAEIQRWVEDQREQRRFNLPQTR